MKRIVGVVVVALMIFGLVPYQLRATAGPIFWVQANNPSSYTGGDVWNDLSGANKHVQLYGTWYHDYASWYGGEYGEMFFESDGYGLAPLVTSANYDVSMEAVFYIIQNTSDTQTVLYNGNESAGNGYGIVVKSNGVSRTIQVQYMGHAPIDTGFVVSVGTPYHVVVTIDSNAQVAVYVNGVLRHSSFYGLPFIPTNNTWIGNSSVSGRGIDGGVPLVRMYDRALTSSEALRLWQGDLSTSTVTATHTFTPTNTPTRTWTSTPTATATPSNTPTFTPTVTSSATSTVTPSDTSTSTVSPTYTATSSATATQTASPSATRVFTPSITPSVTLSSAQKTATSIIYRTQTAVTGATRTKVTGLTRTAAIRTQTASVARAQTQTAYARTRTAQMGRTLTAIRAKTNTVIARTRTRTRTRTATLRRMLIVTMTPTPMVSVVR
ncbi:MAG: LamG-like jellyroll fold domain-containing protein [Chloroflexota bacterium]